MGKHVNADNIPAMLKERDNWVLWSYEDRDGRRTKIPKNAHTGGNAMSNNPETWATFDDALRYLQDHKNNGVCGLGFELGDRLTPFVGVDLDHCRDKQTGKIEPWAAKIVTKLNSYTEITPSEEGLRIFVIGILPSSGRKKGNIEVYDSGRFLTITGNHLEGTPLTIEGRWDEIEEIHREIFGEPGKETTTKPKPSTPVSLEDEELLSKARAAKNGADFSRLYDGDWSAYPSQSEGDMALCCLLAFWTGNDADRIDRLFRESALYRPKWDQKHHSNGNTYGQETIRRAVESNTETYQGPKDQDVTHRVQQEAPAQDTNPIQLVEVNLLDFNMTDSGNAECFKALWGSEYVYVKETGFWMHHDGIRWVQNHQVVLPMLDTMRERQRQALSIQDSDSRKIHLRWSLGSESKMRLNAALSIAESMLPQSITAFDTEPMILCCANGAVDLRTGELFIPTRSHWLSRSTDIEYDPKATCPRFAKFLIEIFKADMDLIDFVQKAIGYSLTGSTIEQVLFILYGMGANGKSVLLNILGDLLGDYSLTTPASTFKDNPYGDGIPNDIARMAGARLVKSSEVKEGTRLNEERVKALTGGDRITARFLHKEYFEFEPTCKFWISVNHKPVVRGSDEAIWRRIRLIPFEVSFPPDKRDPRLYEALKKELPGILAWAVQGCLKWQEEKLEPPKKVSDWTNTYREESDLIVQFLEDRTTRSETGKVKAGDLYKAYDAWCKEHGEYCMTGTRFGKRLEEKGFEKKKVGNIYYHGLELIL